MSVKLVSIYKVKKTAVPLLYELMKERNTNVNISHEKLPTMKDHIKFVGSKPYKKWFLIKDGNEYVGSLYLTKINEIGIFILKKYQRKGYGSDAISQIMKSNNQVLVNINQRNLGAIRLFKKFGFVHIQNTYRWRNEQTEKTI